MKKQAEKRQVPDVDRLKEELKRERYKYRYMGMLRSTVSTLVVVAALAILVATLWMPVLQIYGSSMTPTLEEGQIVISVKGTDFQQGDLVAFYLGNKLLVKRVIAGPADFVSIADDGTVSVNGQVLDEPYVDELALGQCDLLFPYQVPDERYFLMGDHRATSVDSRSSVVGCVAEEQIVGRIVLRVWPLSQMGGIE
ncbi:MAG: signal peptidase I [Ruminococcaceae bacterium]|nr:signal peptidase I [Oscillospiraceae bacterium]